MDHPEEMINLILEHYPSGAGREALAFEARETRALMQPDIIEPGYMQQDRWQQIARTYQEAGMIKAVPNLTPSLQQYPGEPSPAAPTARQERGHRHADLLLPAGPARRLPAPLSASAGRGQ